MWVSMDDLLVKAVEWFFVYSAREAFRVQLVFAQVRLGE
jgi:hypothetical protein